MSKQELSREKGKKTNWTGRIFALVMAGMIVLGGTYTYHQTSTQVSEMPVYVDHVSDGTEVVISEEDVPLAAKPKVRTTKTTKKTTKKVKLSKAAKKTYTKKTKKTKKSSKTKTASGKKVVTKVTVETAVAEKFKKKSKKKTVVTTVTTTTQVTETSLTTGTKTTSSTTTANKASSVSTAVKRQNVDIAELAPKMDSRVTRAYQRLGFTVDIDPSVSYAGYFNARNQSIILKKADDTIYHEAGHFLAFIAGNVDKKSSFEEIYKKEKDKVTGGNKAYVTQDSAEYFAESFKDYTLQPDHLKKTRPETYAAMKSALDKVTDSQISKYKSIYSSVWK